MSVLTIILYIQGEMVEMTVGSKATKKARAYDIYKHSKARNEVCGNKQGLLLKKFKDESAELCEMIRGTISGGVGEKKAYKSLQTAGSAVALRNIRDFQISRRRFPLFASWRPTQTTMSAMAPLKSGTETDNKRATLTRRKGSLFF